MKIAFYERVFLAVSLVMLVAFGVFLFVAVQHGITVAAPAGQVDPRTLTTTPPFDKPGLEEQAPGEYLATIVARRYFFDLGGGPLQKVITVTAGSRVTFQISSIDVVHGFLIPDTTVNIMVLPGEISRTAYTFTEPGEYLILCQEYCGTGHHAMSARLVVTPGVIAARGRPDRLADAARALRKVRDLIGGDR